MKQTTINGKTYIHFKEGKTFKELGLDPNRRFIVLEADGCFEKGEIITLKTDDNSKLPWFWKENKSDYNPIYLKRLAYYDEPLTDDEEINNLKYLYNIELSRLKESYQNTLIITAYEFLNNKQAIKPTNNKPMLNKLTKTLKRALNKDLQAQYKVGYRNGDLELTEKGAKALLDLLAQDKEKELGDEAREEIKEIKE